MNELTEREIWEHSLITGFVPTGEQENSTVAVGLPRDSASLVKSPTVLSTETITTHDRFGRQMTGVPVAVGSVTDGQVSIYGPEVIADTGKKFLTYFVIGVVVLLVARSLFK